MKRLLLSGLIIALAIYFFTCTAKGKKANNVLLTHILPVSHVNTSGMTIYDRLLAPESYNMIAADSGSFGHYIAHYDLKTYDAKVINYDGKPYIYQQGHLGVLDVPVPDNGLQQCADALIRLRAEYLWEQNKQDKIGFNFTSGHYCSWQKYAAGYRPQINGNKVQFSKTAGFDNSKANFYRYLNLIFTYSGTQSLYDELPKITSQKDINIGDMLIYPGFPGHVMMVVAIAENAQGERLFAFVQGNTPAQSVHIIKNIDGGISPWYTIDFENRKYFETPIYTFKSFDFIRFK